MPLLAAALLSMACGAWLGLVRIGWSLPLPWQDQLGAHGPLMVCGFLGTLISLERAVALGARWGYAAPVLVGLGAISLDLGPLVSVPFASPVLVTAGSVVVVAIFAVVSWRQPSLFLLTMGLGAVAWVVGNAQWLGGASIYRVVFWWLAFLVLTIASEHFELNRCGLAATQATFGHDTRSRRCGDRGTLAERRRPCAGVRLIALTAWLALHDVARHACGNAA
jgi:hypothetical protein